MERASSRRVVINTDAKNVADDQFAKGIFAAIRGVSLQQFSLRLHRFY